MVVGVVGEKEEEAIKMKTIETELKQHEQVLEHTINQSAGLINAMAGSMVKCFQQGNKILLCGNGGSAADAQHVAGEFINRFQLDRRALPAIALSTDTSVLTAIGNDSAFENIFSRQVEALGQAGDILVGISTSGSSPDVLKALDSARASGMITIGFTGEKGQETMAPKCDYCLAISSADTPRIQECHIFVWHVICGIVEREMFQNS
jgi:D-sedoheptulose 7-phosphate isomerase